MSDQTTPESTEPKTESHDPAVPEAYSRFMRTGWGDRELDLPRQAVADRAAERRRRLADLFPGERLVLPAGTYKPRANDTDYRFRSDTAHTYLTGNQTSDAVLVLTDGEAVLYARPRSSRETDEFFRDRQYGELWAGRRPSARELSDSLGIEVRHVDRLADDLGRSAPPKTRVHRGVSTHVDRLLAADAGLDDDLARVVSEMRLIKDDWEVEQLQQACDVTTLGFEDSVREWTQVLEYGERWIEGTFFRRARAMGNDIGYDSIVGGGSHATTLHWIENSGAITPGDLVLLDMGVEGRQLYTADVTRTLPVDGTFTGVQRDPLRPGARRPAGRHRRGASRRTVRRHPPGLDERAGPRLEGMGLLPVPAAEALDPDNRTYARWTLHGTSHMLGMDVHDCGRAAPEAYAKGDLAAGMVLTVEPGLYFQEDDLLVPEELRGIGIRIEDDVLVTADGSRNLSAALPRTSADVEEWMGRHLP